VCVLRRCHYLDRTLLSSGMWRRVSW
jgi:hypothetical protein